MHITVATINCFDSPLSLNRKDRINALVFELKKLKPDIVCLQEINFSKTAYRISDVFKESGYNVYYKKGAILTSGGLFTASFFPIINSEFIRFRSQGLFNSLQSTDRILGKGFQKIELVIKGRSVNLFNVHLVNVYKKRSNNEKIMLGRQCGQLIESISKEDNKCIVSGDFNFPVSDPLYFKLLKKTKLLDPSAGFDVVTLAIHNTNRQGLHKGEVDTKLDYTFVSSGLSKKISQSVLFQDLYEVNNKKVHLSDHFGLITRLDL